MINARNVVVFDDARIPSIMVRFDKCKNADLFVGGSEQTHPAFIINGEEVESIYISKYPCTMINGKPYSLPFMPPATEITLDSAAAACFSKGAGWHLMTAAEWGLAALESALGDLPRGNTNSGASHSHPEEQGARYECGNGKTLTGSGPSAWAHDHTPYGVYDLCGNVWEWIAGLRLMDGRIDIINNNDAANPIDTSRSSPLWTPVPSHGGKPTRFAIEGCNVKFTDRADIPADWDGCAWRDVEFEIEPTELLKALAICPVDTADEKSYLFTNCDGERLPCRGGSWGSAANAGVFALSLYPPRSNVYTNIGFRAAYYCKTEN